MEIGRANKRGRPEVGLNGHGGFKKSKQEVESITSGIGSKLKPCTKFFSSSGCSFGDGCHFIHYIPGGIKAVTQIVGHNPSLPPAAKNPIPPPPAPFQDWPGPGPTPFTKTRLCNKFKTAEGCKFGANCHFAHGEWELGNPTTGPQPHDDHRGRFGRSNRPEPCPQNPAATMAVGFGASATAKISINASLAGPVIGKGGFNSKQICRVTGAKLSVRDHETDANLRNIELEGSFDQINEASRMVQELIVNIRTGSAGRVANMVGGGGGGGIGFANSYKTKICEKFNKGLCTFGERCHFAHGEGELRTSAGL